MNTFKITLTETKEFNLIPFGMFKVKWKASYKLNKKVGILTVYDISFNYDSGMPCDGENDKAVIKYMVKHKTDVLTNVHCNIFYTRLGKGFTEIKHDKLIKYKHFLINNEFKDSPETWEKYKYENREY
jgi:hypothetical protein